MRLLTYAAVLTALLANLLFALTPQPFAMLNAFVCIGCMCVLSGMASYDLMETCFGEKDGAS